jgi:hypothetical protein
MAPTLGKRKRITREDLEQPSRSPSPSSASSDEDGEDMQDIFRRAFEAKFKPLDVEPKKVKTETVVEEDGGESEEESAWSGISSENEDANGIEVIEYGGSRPTNEKASKAEMKAFMSSRPPSSTGAALQPASKKSSKDDGDLTEAKHLKNDLALQRLLRDSHMLSSLSPSSAGTSGTSTPTLSASGSLRHKSTDLHIRSLGAKSSVHAQKNMPMSHRKGIAKKSAEREDRRRKEAKENGVILEREVRKKKFTGSRDKGVGGPTVGKFRGGMLKLSKRDVASITGGGGGMGAKGKGKKGRR